MWKKIFTAPVKGWKKMPGPAKTLIVSGAAGFLGGFVPGFAQVINDATHPSYPGIPWQDAYQAGFDAGVRGIVGIVTASSDGIVPGVTAGGALIAHLMKSPIQGRTATPAQVAVTPPHPHPTQPIQLRIQAPPPETLETLDTPELPEIPAEPPALDLAAPVPLPPPLPLPAPPPPPAAPELPKRQYRIIG